MSLLLDALKKAAQEKLNKEGGEGGEQATTVIEQEPAGHDLHQHSGATQYEIDEDALADFATDRTVAEFEDTNVRHDTTSGDIAIAFDDDHVADSRAEPPPRTELELEPYSDQTGELRLDTTGIEQAYTDVNSAGSRLSATEVDRFLSDGDTTTNVHARAEKSRFAFEGDDTDTRDPGYSASLTENLQEQQARYYGGSQQQAAQLFNAKNSGTNNTRLYLLIGSAVLAFLLVGALFAYGYITELNDSTVVTASPRSRPPAQAKPAAAAAQASTSDVDPALLIEQENYSEILQHTLQEYESEPVTQNTADKTHAAKPVTRAAPRQAQPKSQSGQRSTVASQRGEYSISRGQKNVGEPLHNILLRGYNAYNDGDYATAQVSYQQALGRSPGNRDALLGLAAVHTARGEKDSAKSYYQQLLQLDPKDDLALAGMTALQADTDGAATASVDSDVSRIKLMLAEKNDSASLHFALGNLYAARRRWAEAQQAYFDAFRLANNNPDYAFNLAISLEHLGQPQAALRFYRQALSLADTQHAHFALETVNGRIQALGN